MPSRVNRRHRNCQISKDQHPLSSSEPDRSPGGEEHHTNVIALHANSGRGVMQRKPAHQAESVTDIRYDTGPVQTPSVFSDNELSLLSRVFAFHLFEGIPAHLRQVIGIWFQTATGQMSGRIRSAALRGSTAAPCTLPSSSPGPAWP
jgi:hypothetical protein